MRYADAAYTNNEDYKSTSSYVFIAQGGAITWQSKKQTTIALSSMEAEYVAIVGKTGGARGKRVGLSVGKRTRVPRGYVQVLMMSK